VTEILSGVDALARLLVLRAQLDARDGLTTATMVSGYPGSPMGAYDLAVEALGEALAEHRIVHRPGVNEELAAVTVWGSQMGSVIPYDGVDGVAGAWYGKGPGLDRSGDALKHANAMGAGPNGGVVAFCGDDPGAKSSTLACDSQHTFEDACVPVLYPADQQDAVDLGVQAFRLSRYAGCWVGMKIVTAVADGIGTVDLDPARQPAVDLPGGPWRHQPLAAIGPHAVPDQEDLVVGQRLRAAQDYVRHNGLDRVEGAGPGARLGVVCAGKTSTDLRQALADLGVDPAEAGVRVLKLAMTYPLVEETVREFAESVDRVLVVEEKRPFVETQLRFVLHEAGSRVPVLGKRDGAGKPLVRSTGELDPAAVADVLGRVLPDLRPSRPVSRPIALPLVALPSRAPGFCSGCPHNRSTVVPEGALVGGGVGCHGIMYFEARHRDTRRLPAPPMGAEGVPWLGLAPFVAEPHLIQNLGDGTLSHSGSLAIRAAVAAGADITFKVLYNAAVAMTGGQDVTGLQDVPAMTRALAAEGVAEIVVCAEEPKRYGRRADWGPRTTVLGRDRLDDTQRRLREVPGVTVIIYDQRCAAESRRLRKRGLLPEPPRRVVINEAVCEGCGDCGAKSNCLSVLPVDTEFGDKRQIHDPSCNRDYTCLEGHCPSFVTITPRRSPFTAARSAKARDRPALPPGALPEPARPAIEGRYGISFSGIGGTGVVTANRIVAAAAEAAGLAVGGLDQTGLSQKAGAVVSHLQLAADQAGLGASAIGVGGADLYLSGDILQAAAPAQLARTRPGRTIAVVEKALTPTSAMLQAGGEPDVEAMRQAVADRVGADRIAFVDAGDIAGRVFNDHLLANIVLLGAAFQLAGLPLGAEHLEKALRRRGAANREAFAWGRWAAHDPAAVTAALAGTEPPAGPFEPTPEALVTATALCARRRLPLPELLVRRAAQAIDYQDVRRAERFLDLVERVAATDDAERGWALTRAVAESWFKVLTYKDEYEVARLHLATDYRRMARDLGITGGYKVTYHLHPPFLIRLGMTRKLPLGKPYELGFRVLRRMKRLRGTPLDPFGLDRDRRAERALIVEFERLVQDTADLPYAARVELAASIQAVRGYESIKEAALVEWRERVEVLRRVPVPPLATGAR
jgi:indolepyruvate ferredoxin oxidoreductase